MKKLIILIVIVLLGLLVWYYRPTPILGGTSNITSVASSTSFTLTTTSQRLVATSTKRSSLAIQPVNCTSSTAKVYLKIDPTTDDTVAVAGSGYVVFGTSTAIFNDTDTNPTINSMWGIVDAGTCTVLVTEWRSAF